MKLKFAILILLLVLSLSIFRGNALDDSDYQARSVDDFNTYILEDYELRFITGDNYVGLFMISGNLNGSDCYMWMGATIGGKFSFESQENATIYFDTNIAKVRINGNPVVDTSNFSIVETNRYDVEWSYVYNPILPVGFILGVFGIMFLISSPCYAVIKIKNNQFEQGITMGAIMFTIGIALLIGWLTI